MSEDRKVKKGRILRPSEFAIGAAFDGNFRFYPAVDIPDAPLPLNIRVLTAVSMKLHDPAFIEEMLAFLEEDGVCPGECCAECARDRSGK